MYAVNIDMPCIRHFSTQLAMTVTDIHCSHGCEMIRVFFVDSLNIKRSSLKCLNQPVAIVPAFQNCL